MATFTNRATIAWGDTVRDSNVVTGEIVEVLSMTKNAARGTYLPGDTVTYIVSIRNSGTTPFTALTVTDDLGAYPVGDPPVTVTPLTYIDGSVQQYVNGELTAPPAVTEDDELTQKQGAACTCSTLSVYDLIASFSPASGCRSSARRRARSAPPRSCRRKG